MALVSLVSAVLGLAVLGAAVLGQLPKDWTFGPCSRNPRRKQICDKSRNSGFYVLHIILASNPHGTDMSGYGYLPDGLLKLGLAWLGGDRQWEEPHGLSPH